ncbi:hypothetical protein HN873_008038, partial [Arachis hypogaea]
MILLVIQTAIIPLFFWKLGGLYQWDTREVEAVLELIRKQTQLTVKQEKFCNYACVERFLKQKGDNVKRAAKQLKSCLSWKDSIGTEIGIYFWLNFGASFLFRCNKEKIVSSHLRSFARRNLEQAKSLVQAVIKATYELTSDSLSQNETEFSEDSLALSRLAPYSSKFVSSEEEFFESDMMTSHPHSRPSVVQIHPSYDANPAMLPAAFSKQEFRRQHVWDDSIIETAEERFDGSEIGDFINAIQENITIFCFMQKLDKEWDFEVKGWKTCNSNKTTCPDMYVPVHSWPRMGGHRFIGMGTQYQKLTRKCEVIPILVLYGLP